MFFFSLHGFIVVSLVFLGLQVFINLHVSMPFRCFFLLQVSLSHDFRYADVALDSRCNVNSPDVF